MVEDNASGEIRFVPCLIKGLPPEKSVAATTPRFFRRRRTRTDDNCSIIALDSIVISRLVIIGYYDDRNGLYLPDTSTW
jgi:hypothetical protein